MVEAYSLSAFFEKFKDNDTCLEFIKDLRYPNGIFCKSCKTITKFYKVKSRTTYACSCGWQVSPLVGTPFENSHISLQDWFFAIFVMTTTRCGISAAQLKRQLRVNYKTAWRVLHKIRSLMGEDEKDLLNGTVEIDEGYVGWWRPYKVIPEKQYEVVLGMVERKGKARLRHIVDNSRYSIWEEIKKNVGRDANVMTDHNISYQGLKKYLGYNHQFVTHQREFVRGNVHTQTVESGWGMLKRSISGTYHKVSHQHLQKYLNEFEWRYNHRKHGEQMFEILLRQVAEVKVVKPSQPTKNRLAAAF